jgi:lipopolysaccharide export system protein LptA
MTALLVALAAVAGPPASAAAAPGKTGPVRVDADEVHYAFQKREVIFTGAPVVLRREDATLNCRRLVATNDARGQVAHAVCSGDVKFTRGDRIVTCEKATYDEAEARLICDGNPVLRDGPSEARGKRLVYDLRSDEAKLEGEPGKPVQIVAPGASFEQRRRELDAKRKPVPSAAPPSGRSGVEGGAGK